MVDSDLLGLWDKGRIKSLPSGNTKLSLGDVVGKQQMCLRWCIVFVGRYEAIRSKSRVKL